MYNIISYTPTPEFWFTLSGLGAFLGKILIDELRYKKERQAKLDEQDKELKRREQDRLDIAAVAVLTAQQIDAVKEDIIKNGQDRMKVLLNSAVTTRGIVKDFAKKAEVAIETSNGIKEALRNDGVKLIETKSE